jgi:hypothetical protein
VTEEEASSDLRAWLLTPPVQISKMLDKNFETRISADEVRSVSVFLFCV